MAITSFAACNKDSAVNELEGNIEFRSPNAPPLLKKDWVSGSYLIFTDSTDFLNAKITITTLKSSLLNVSSPTQELNGIENPALDNWETTQLSTYVSMRKAYEQYEHLGLDAGLDPSDIEDIPIIDEALATLVSPDGLVQIGNNIYYLSEKVEAVAPIGSINTLKGIIEGTINYTPAHEITGILLNIRHTTAVCDSDFTFAINHTTKQVTVTYTGSTPSGTDKALTWSVSDGTGSYTNQTNFTHTFATVGEKQICAIYTEYGLVTKIGYNYYSQVRDSSYFVLDRFGKDSLVTIQINYTVAVPYTYQEKGIVCMSKKCLNLTIGGCTAEFDFTIGIDNVVTFTNLSSTPHGNITSYLWQFGDGTTSTVANPTHAYPCNKEWTVTLIIFSDQCPGGQYSRSKKLDAKGAACCDSNPQSPWIRSETWDLERKVIEYRYDMGTWDIMGFLDQDFKVKMKNFEKNSKGKWKKDPSNLSVVVTGDLYGTDEDNCQCIRAIPLNVQPINSVHKKDYTFVDPLASSFFSSSKKLKMKEGFDVTIQYYVDGYLADTQMCQHSPDFQCEN